MDCTNTDIFSPIRNFDEVKINRQSDGFSEFLKGPDIFKKKSVNSETWENVDENIPVNNISNTKSSKAHQKKTSKYEMYKSKEELASSTSTHDSVFIISPEKSSSVKKDRSKNLLFTSKRNDKLRTNQRNEAECNNKKKEDSQSAKKHSINLAKGSLQSGAVAVPIFSRSKEIKKADNSSSASQCNPLSQIKSGVLEKIINDAVESQVDDIRKSLWSHHLNLLKAIYNIQDEMEKRQTENISMFKIIEQLLEENRLLRTALLARE